MLDSAQYHTAPSKKNPPKPDSAQYDTGQNFTPHSIILHRARLRAVSYCAESTNEFGGKSSAQYETAQSWTPRSIILSGITLHILRGVNCHFFKVLHRPLKGQFHKNKYIFRLC